MARTKRILFLLDFITNLAKTYCRALKKAKNITSASPLDFAINPHAQFGKKLCNAKNAPVTEVKGLFSKSIKFIAPL